MDVQIRTMIEQQLEAQNQQLATVLTTQGELAKMMTKLDELTKKRSLEVNKEVPSNPDRNSFKFLPNLEFPSFDGVNPRNWIRKCSRYFSLYKIPESQRVEVASIHFTGRAAAWFANYSVVRKNVDWCDFILDVCTCFQEELGITRQPNSGSGNPPSEDAPQVLDKSPKSNPDISSHGWVGEGQEKSPVGSQNALGGQLDRLNPSNGLFEKSTSCIHDQLTFNVQGQPQGNVQPFPAEWSKLIASTRCDDGKKTPATGICCADEAALCPDMEIGEEFYMPAGYSKVLGLKSVVPELQDPNQGKKHWIPKKPEWKEANGFCELVFDPGILGPGQSALQHQFSHKVFEERHHSIGHVGNHVKGAARRSEVSPGNARLPFKKQMPSKTSISRMDASCSNINNVDKVSLVENSGAVDVDFKAVRGSSLCTNEDVNMEGKSLPKELNLQNRSTETCDACAVETETEKNKEEDNASSKELNPPCDMVSEMSMTDREIASACLDDLEMTRGKGKHRCPAEEQDMQDKVREISMSDANMTCSSACLKEFGMEKEYEEGKNLLEELDPCDQDNDRERNEQSFTIHTTIVPTTETGLYAENTKANLEREWTAAEVNTSVIEPNEMLDVHHLKKNLQMATALYKLVAERTLWSSLSRWALEAYLKGDVGKALLLYSRMAELGYEVAQSKATWILDKYGEHSMCTGASGFCTDAERYQRAHSLWWQASEQGNEHAALLMRYTYYYGRGTDRDYECAAEAYMHAKSQSNAQAMFNLGYMHEHGQGLPYHLHLAKRYYDQALEIDPASFVVVKQAVARLIFDPGGITVAASIFQRFVAGLWLLSIVGNLQKMLLSWRGNHCVCFFLFCCLCLLHCLLSVFVSGSFLYVCCEFCPVRPFFFMGGGNLIQEI